MNLGKRFRIEPGSSVDLSSIDAGFHGPYDNEAAATSDIQKHLERISKLQRTLYADHRHALLIVLQGIDRAGKDGTC